MRNKTFLSPEEQWLRTVELWSRHGNYARYAASALGRGNVYLGQIVRTHRLFLPGDVVIVERAHGGGGRHVVYAVSSKGFIIRRKYLKFETFKRTIVRIPKGTKKLRGVKSKRRRPPAPMRSHVKYDDIGSGPMRLVEYPESLKDQFPDSPPVRRFVVESLRAR